MDDAALVGHGVKGHMLLGKHLQLTAQVTQGDADDDVHADGQQEAEKTLLDQTDDQQHNCHDEANNAGALGDLVGDKDGAAICQPAQAALEQHRGNDAEHNGDKQHPNITGADGAYRVLQITVGIKAADTGGQIGNTHQQDDH